MHGARPLVFIDFDDTLFSQKLFYEWLDVFLTGHAVPRGTFSKSSDDFHTIKGELIRLYDHEGHFKALTGREWAYLSAEIEAALRREEMDFCFPDAHDFLQHLVRGGYEPRLLTYGDPAFQYFKITLCPLLRRLNLPKHVVREAKNSFLTKEFGNVPGVLIDDKGPLNLPANWTHIWLKRSGGKTAEADGNTVIVSGLAQANALLNYDLARPGLV